MHKQRRDFFQKSQKLTTLQLKKNGFIFVKLILQLFELEILELGKYILFSWNF